jgi:hypothetical protein
MLVAWPEVPERKPKMSTEGTRLKPDGVAKQPLMALLPVKDGRWYANEELSHLCAQTLLIHDRHGRAAHGCLPVSSMPVHLSCIVIVH